MYKEGIVNTVFKGDPAVTVLALSNAALKANVNT
jgi:hypothetical protein